MMKGNRHTNAAATRNQRLTWLGGKGLVSAIDLLPTFMDAARRPPPRGLPGKSLRPVLEGTAEQDFREFLACERNCDAARHTFPQRLMSVRSSAGV
jgi:arylsulfatase A-like enzyme